jgi:rare lipoprotein A
LQGVQTYSGETFDNNKPVAAHPSYPMGTIVRVINLRNNRAVEVRVIDRSASVKLRGGGYIISLSSSAAEQLDFIRDGKVNVRIEVLEWGRKS